MTRWKCVCAYDGTDYFGWQTQSNQVSVQTVIEKGLQQILKESIAIYGSGRTDAGVHACEQVFHFDHDWRHGASRLLRALSTVIPRDIQISSVVEVDDSFHARFSAKSKRYHYKLFQGTARPFDWKYCWSIPQGLNLNLVKEALPYLSGERDFAPFASNRGVEYETTIRNVFASEMYQKDGFIYLSFEADGFMYKMVRSFVGALVNVGLGRLGLEQFCKIVESGKREPLIQVAPPQGLFLEKVFY
ncbi:tRNA pseudouridine(38-40) synthase TruA [Puniceicoccaceae bacterium K14]|nr:tRNA pseudouridine(38-40) synthase TruA [Puniceicoccaceae bacterium K14]